jgi:hypothetical protein
MNNICMLSPFDAEEFQERSVRPDCRDHRHCSERKAAELVGSGKARVLGLSIASGRIGMAPDEFPQRIKSDGYAATQWRPAAIAIGRSAVNSRYRRGSYGRDL